MSQPSIADSGKSQTSSGGTIALVLFLTIFALGFGAIGMVMLRSAHAKEQICSAQAEGHIIDYRESTHKRTHMYSPVIEYQVDGQYYTSETNVSLSYRPYQQAEKENLTHSLLIPYSNIKTRIPFKEALS